MELGNLLFGHSHGEFKVPRGFIKGTFEWDDRFCLFLEKIGCDDYGYAENKDNPLKNERGGITTPEFEINPYYWGDDETEEDKPNFIFKPTGYEMRWYKYPLRDSYANQELTYKEFNAMLKKCEEFMENYK